MTCYAFLHISESYTRFVFDLYPVWAGFHERDREGGKYIVAEKPVKQVRRDNCLGSESSVTKERESRKETFDFFGDGNGTSEAGDPHSGMLNVLLQM